MSQSSKAKKIRREVEKQTDALRDEAVRRVINSLYQMPFLRRVKWAYKIARGPKVDRLLMWMELLVWTLDFALEWLTRKGADVFFPSKKKS